jgi:acetyltransferase
MSSEKDGRSRPVDGLVIRPLVPADRDLLAQLPSRISSQSAYSRFHAPLHALNALVLDLLLDLQDGQREAVVAVDQKGIVAVGRYARETPDSDTGEVAMLVADEWQHHGIGHRLLLQLSDRAVAAGITRLRADMLTGNIAAQKLFRDLAPVIRTRFDGGHTILTVDLLSGLQRCPAGPDTS